MGGVQLVGQTVVLERLLLVAQLFRRLGQAVVQDVEFAVGSTIRLAHQHLQQGHERRPCTLAVVDVGQRGGRLNVFRIELNRACVEFLGLCFVTQFRLIELGRLMQKPRPLQHARRVGFGPDHELGCLEGVAPPLVDVEQ